MGHQSLLDLNVVHSPKISKSTSNLTGISTLCMKG
jgi:hypothetical protein